MRDINAGFLLGDRIPAAVITFCVDDASKVHANLAIDSPFQLM